MYIDGDTHYWPVRFLERVDHPGRGHLEFKKGAGEMIRYGERFPGDAATYHRDGKKIHSFSETRWNLEMHREVMAREGFDYQVVIPDNRPLIYEVERDLGIAMARAYNDTVAERDRREGLLYRDRLGLPAGRGRGDSRAQARRKGPRLKRRQADGRP